jgi:bifunctional non-homologous end joining protein LigD
VCPFTPRPAGWLGRNAHWVRPELVCEVAFTEWTGDGSLRHPSFQGLREDKKATEVTRERAAPMATATSSSNPTSTAKPTLTSTANPTLTSSPTPRKRSSRTRKPTETIGGIAVTNPDRVMYPDAGYTKRDVVRYYEAVASAILPHLAGRPLTLYHCPHGLSGACQFMRHSKVWALPALRRVRIQEKTKVGEYLVADTPAALLSLAQMDVLELHTWSSTVDRLEEPDRILLDLDPGPDVGFAEVVRAARLVRDALASIGLAAFVKTTGGRGLHVAVPLAPERPWQECLSFAKGLAIALERHDPRRFTTAFAKAGRERKILLDYLRNNRTSTAVCAYSTRARPGAPVSVPLAWDELTARLRPDRFTLRTVPRRLATLGEDPWRGWDGARRALDRKRQDAVAGLSSGA